LLVFSLNSFALMNLSENRRALWPALVLIAAIPRILGAFFLPNTFGDAYVYIRDIGNLSTKIKAGTFALTDLYGFWLPLYQLISAAINLFVGNGFYVGKIVAALFGIGGCLLVYALALRLTEHKFAALLTFLLIALNPLHILNSTSALTDVPHAFFVLASMYFVLQRSWIAAALLAALAGCTRVESWMFLALLPLIQFWKERRVSIPAILILLIPPLSWFYISWKATGDWLACFRVRQQYHDWLLLQNPSLAQFSVPGVGKDVAMFMSGADLAVLVSAFLAAWFVLRKLLNRSRSVNTVSTVDPKNLGSIVPLLLVFFAFFALLSIAYLTHQQPIIFPRYGLILFSLGIPILAWTYLAITRQRPEWSRRILTTVIVLCALNWSAQFAGAVGELNRYSAQRRVADYLRDNVDTKSSAKIFCDEDTVKVLSGIPEERFSSSASAPSDRESFVKFLNDRSVEYLIIAEADRSRPFELYRLAAGYNASIGNYQFIMHAHSEFLRTDIHVYRRAQSAAERRQSLAQGEASAASGTLGNARS
jgi:hypothetical protein